ncbi:MAG: 30S ribosomal protein S27ae [Thermoproteota archaeon]|nr:30S ribosomal protein S27ae [Thermoproteota archaeon]
MAKDSKGQVSIYKFYKIDKDTIEKIKRECPRCGKGIFMADHSDRFACGKCGYTEFKKDHSKKSKKSQ